MDEKKFVIFQGNWPLTDALPAWKADAEKNRLSEWFSGLNKVEVQELNHQTKLPTANYRVD